MPSEDTELLLKLVEARIGAMQEQLNTRSTATQTELVALRQILEDRHVEVMELIQGGFPDGDLKSHYQYHMRLIEEAQTKKAIRLEVIKKLVSGSIWSMLAYLGFKLFEWVRDHVKF